MLLGVSDSDNWPIGRETVQMIPFVTISWIEMLILIIIVFVLAFLLYRRFR
jgi:hypothetical protein